MNRRTRRIVLILLYLLGSGAILFGLSKIYVYFNEGADRRSLMDDSFRNVQSLQMPFSWQSTADIDRRLGPESQLQLAQQYMEAIQAKQLGTVTGSDHLIAEHFTEDFAEDLSQVIETYDQVNRIEEQTLSHHLTLTFLSEDGIVAIIKDSAAIETAHIYASDTLSHSFRSTASYRALLLLQDGRWRIRQLQQLVRKERVDQVITAASDVSEIKGINYYPKDHAWEMFGEKFDTLAIANDFSTIRDLGLNTIRIFFPYRQNDVDDLDDLISQVQTTLDLAAKANLDVMVTLFDMYGDYSLQDWPRTALHLKRVVSALKNYAALSAWDIKNEPDLDFNSRGKTRVLSWLQDMIFLLRQLDSAHPVTIGWSATEPAKYLSANVDFVSFHHYGNPDDLASDVEVLKKEVEEKQLLLGEFGLSSYRGLWKPFGSKLNDQSKYHRDIQATIATHSLPWMVWTLHDFDDVPTKVVGRLPWRREPQKYFGFFDHDGNPKPALEFIRSEE